MGRRAPKRWMIGGLAVASALLLTLAKLQVSRQRDPLASGISAYGRGDWPEALAEARRTLETRRTDPAALRLLARASARLGRDDSAEAIYRRLGADRMDAEDLFLLGRGLLKSGRPGPALASLRAARDAEPDHAETLDAMADRYAEVGSIEEAAEAADRLSKQPGWEARGRVRLAPLLRRLRDPSGATAAISGALAIDPKLRGASITPAEATRLLAGSLLECGRADEAGRALQQAESSGQEDEVAWLLSRVLLQRGRGAEARTALKGSGNFGEADPMRPEPSPFVGTARCSTCHARQFDVQQRSRHASTFVRTADLKAIAWPSHPVADPANPQVRHTFHRSAAGIEITTSMAGEEFRALIEYALGSNHQGQSFLARDGEGRTRELRISRFPVVPVWDRTNQHPERPPDAFGYLGRPLSAASAASCLDCHVTSSTAVRKPAGHPEAGDRGIGCERCHGPGGNHILAVEANFPEPAIARPRLAKADRIMTLCGECHKAPAGTSADDPGFIRFQVPNLQLSRCYIESEGGMSCVTCHDPHRDAARSSSHYERICLNCHGPGQALTNKPKDVHSAARCPVNPSTRCLECHMPRVIDAVPRATFADHFIRVHRDASQALHNDAPAGP